MVEAGLVLARFGQLLAIGLFFGIALFGRPGPRTIAILAAAALAASAAAFLAMAADMAGGAAQLDVATLAMIVGLPGAGVAFLIRSAALGAALPAILLMPRQCRFWAVVAGGVAVASLAWSGHAAAGEGMAGHWQRAGDIVHLLAASAWLGALVVFVRAARQRLPAPDLAMRLKAFATAGTAIVLLLAATGAANIAFIVGMPPPATALQSTWTQLIALKLVVFAFMLLLAVRHRYILVPALARDPAVLGKLRLSLAVEWAAILCVLALVAWAGRLDPGGA